jgi:C4-dicarboxylate-specific signal transduction histidine kinase
VELQQVVIHLLINAMEALAVAAPPRRLRLATRVKAGSDCVRIEVGDNGAGVPPDLRREIFEPWCTTRPGALGLGLAVARSIIDTHNGKIALRDDIGDMTWFDIEIPAVRRHE